MYPLPNKLKSTLIILALVIPTLFWVTFYLWSLVSALIFRNEAIGSLDDPVFFMGDSTLEWLLKVALVISAIIYPLWLKQVFVRSQYQRALARGIGFIAGTIISLEYSFLSMQLLGKYGCRHDWCFMGAFVSWPINFVYGMIGIMSLILWYVRGRKMGNLPSA